LIVAGDSVFSFYFRNMKYRPSKSFIYLMVIFCPLVIALGFGLLPEVPGFAVRPIPGDITFKHEKPEALRIATVSAGSNATFKWPLDWLQVSFENVMKWEYNPWKHKPNEFGGHFVKLTESKDPMDQAKVRELRRLAEVWYQRLLARFPELAISMRSVPDDKNGFLKWLDFSDKMKSGSPTGVAQIDFPKELDDYLNNKGAWNPESAKAWLAQQKPLLDEVRAIGLMPDQSVNGIPIERWGFINARLVKGCGDALMVEARAAAGDGDAAGALESVRAGKGLADHLGEVETPSTLAATVQFLLQLSLENRVMADIIPSLPADQVDPVAWEDVVRPTVSQPAGFARLVRAEWSASSRYYLLPMLLDAEDPKNPPDSAEVLDLYSMCFLETVHLHEGAAISDLPTLEVPLMSDDSHLSRSGREAMSMIYLDARAWRKGWDRAQSVFAMDQAAFAILKGELIPKDPIYGTDYQWDPVTRQLSMPAGKEFEGMKIKPIIVPKL
jgi:hypothetical protein